MRLSKRELSGLCREKSLTVSRLLEQAGVSRNAFYSLLRKGDILPKSVTALARTLGVSPSAILEWKGQR